MKNTEKEDRRRSRLGALAVTLQKTNRIITGFGDVKVSFGPAPALVAHAPAWNDGRSITINEAMMPPIESASGLVTILGLNYHELSHVMYTHSRSEGWVNDISLKGEFTTYNMLEDMRIETLFSASYINAKKFLTAPVLEYIVKDEDTWPTAHLLTYGRRYLPRAIRDELRKRFTGDDLMREQAERIIDRYRMMDLSTASETYSARELVRQMHVLLNGVKQQLPPQQQKAMDAVLACGSMDNGFENTKTRVQASVQESSPRREEENAAQEQKEENGEDGSGFDDTAGHDPANGGDPDPTDPSGGSGDDGQASGDSGDPNAADPSAGHKDGQDGSGPKGGAAGTSGDDDGDSTKGDPSTVGGNSSAKVKRLAQELIESLEQSQEVQDEVTRLNDAMNDDNNVDVMLKDITHLSEAPSSDAVSASQTITRELGALHAQFEAGWEYGTDYGKINVQRAMTAEFGDTDIYDQWDEGNEDSAGLECVIALDVSGSMRGGIKAACEAVWALKVGVDEIDAETTVMTFGEDSKRLYGRGEKANPSMVKQVDDLEGSTNPIGVMEEARRIINQSERPNRLFVIVTDGQFDGGISRAHTYRGLLESINATRVFVGIETRTSEDLRKCYDVHREIKNPREITDIVREAVKSMLDEALKSR